jgi:hypothetical protein
MEAVMPPGDQECLTTRHSAYGPILESGGLTMNVRLWDSSSRLGVFSSWSCLRRLTWRQATAARQILVVGSLVLATGPGVLARQAYPATTAYQADAVTGLGILGQAVSNTCGSTWSYPLYGLPGMGVPR